MSTFYDNTGCLLLAQVYPAETNFGGKKHLPFLIRFPFSYAYHSLHIV